MTIASTFNVGDLITLQHEIVGWDHSKRPGLIAAGETVCIDQVWRVEGSERVYCHVRSGDFATWVEGSDIVLVEEAKG